MWGHPVEGEEEPEEVPPPRPIRPLPRRSANGSVAFAIALGLRQVFEPERPREDAVVMAEAPTRPEGDIDLRLDFTHPALSSAVVRRRRRE